MMSLLLAAASMLVGPAIPATAQVNNESDGPGPIEIEAVVSGQTNPPEDEHTLAVNRVAGPSKFEGLVIGGVVTCTETTPPSVNVVNLTTPHAVDFFADDDITDGFGEVSPTDDARQFEGTAVGGNIVRARIEAGRFHRLFGIVEVDLDLDIRVTDANDNPICHFTNIPFRVIFQLLPDLDVNGFVLVGVGRRHHRIHLRVTDDQNNQVFHVRVWTRASIARTVCGIVGEHSPRVSEPTRGSTIPDTIPGGSTIPGGGSTIPHGRGDFHPCEGEGTPVSDIVQVET